MKNYKNYLFTPITINLILLILSASSCSKKIYTNGVNYSFGRSNEAPDYSNLNYWAAHPWKYDPSDNSPANLGKNKNDSLADVFFIYPTTYTKLSMPMGWNANVNDEELNKKTDNGTILYQASTFNQHCRVFAPRYRQANLKAFFTNNKNAANKAFEAAYSDVRRAFEYYLENYNHGRPIIIASHSQGTLHAKKLLKEFFEGKPLQKQLVCAYLIGFPVFTNEYSQIIPCNDASATGCIVTWRTFHEDYTSPVVAAELIKAIVTNPLTWSTTGEYAPATLDKGSILRNFNKSIPGLVHAQVHGNVLWVNKPKFFGSAFFRLKNYHIIDYNLFYVNIRDNVETRINAFLKK